LASGEKAKDLVFEEARQAIRVDLCMGARGSITDCRYEGGEFRVVRVGAGGEPAEYSARYRSSAGKCGSEGGQEQRGSAHISEMAVRGRFCETTILHINCKPAALGRLGAICMDDCGEQILVRGGIGPWGGLEHGRGYVR
jgi:hypothetical protein